MTPTYTQPKQNHTYPHTAKKVSLAHTHIYLRPDKIAPIYPIYLSRLTQKGFTAESTELNLS